MNYIEDAKKYGGTLVKPNEQGKVDYLKDAQKYGGTLVDSNVVSTGLASSQNIWSKISQGFQDISTGVAQSELGTVAGLGTLTSEAGSMLPGKAGEFFAGGAEKGKEILSSPAMQPQNLGQQIGKTGADIAQFFIPAGEVGKAEEIISGFSKVPSLAKVALKAGTEALAGGGVTLAQTADIKQALTSALTFGVLKGTTGAVGEGLKALGIPEHLYSTIFKTSARDMLDELKSGGLITLQKENPTLFKQFVEEGVIKTSGGGALTLDESLAKQALDRGLRGSTRNMANVLVKQTLENESKAQTLAKTATKPIIVPSIDKLTNILQTVATDYENVGQGEITTKAKGFIDALNKNNGEIDASTGLSLRRFLDGMRAKSSYNPQIKLSTTGENFKYWSNAVRREINKVPGMSPLMKDYSFNIEALTSLAKTAAIRGNQAVVNMLDVLIFEGGLQGGVPGIGAGMSIFRKAMTTPWGATMTGSAIENAGRMSKTGALIKGAISKGASAIFGGSDQEQQ